MFLGIIFGLLAATAQSGAYLFSKDFFLRHGTPLQLLVGAHILMGFWAFFTLVGMCFFFDFPPLSSFMFPVCMSNLMYVIGQFAFFMALKYSEPSRISPLLALKIVAVTLLMALFFGGEYNAWQWGAVVLCVGGALISNNAGGGIDKRSLIGLLVTCFCWALADIYETRAIQSVQLGNILVDSLATAAICYFIMGLAALAVCKFVPGFRFPGQRAIHFYKVWTGMPGLVGKHVRKSLPYGLCWYLSMVALFACFGLIGPVFGNIVQSTRGIISILMGMLLARLGRSALEKEVSPRVLIERFAAALLMLAALVIFSFAKINTNPEESNEKAAESAAVTLAHPAPRASDLGYDHQESDSDHR